MKLKIMTPEKLVFDEDVVSVTLPGELGQMTALSGHDILMSSLKKGRLYLRRNDDRREDFDLGAGSVEITKDSIAVFASTALKITAGS